MVKIVSIVGEPLQPLCGSLEIKAMCALTNMFGYNKSKIWSFYSKCLKSSRRDLSGKGGSGDASSPETQRFHYAFKPYCEMKTKIIDFKFY